MKKLTTLFSILLVTHLSYASITIDTLIKERIELREEYKAEYIERSKDEAPQTDISKIESEHGDAWITLLKIAQSTKDSEVKKRILELDLLNDLAVAKWDLFYAESKPDTEYFQERVKLYETQLKLVRGSGSNRVARSINSPRPHTTGHTGP